MSRETNFEGLAILCMTVFCMSAGGLCGWILCDASWRGALIDDPADIATITSIEKLKRQTQELERGR
jgi:hypothetical protein